MGLQIVPPDIRARYKVKEWKHALAVLQTDSPKELADIFKILRSFTLLQSHILGGGGQRSYVSRCLDSAFYREGWKETKFKTEIVVKRQIKKGTNKFKTVKTESNRVPTHRVDCVKRRVALEIEWSNKDPFFDRDLNNFRLLFELRAVKVGVIITKDNDLIPTLRENKIWKKYGASTTWMSKLVPRIKGGGAGGCPVVVFAIRKECYYADVPLEWREDFDKRVKDAFKQYEAERKQRLATAKQAKKETDRVAREQRNAERPSKKKRDLAAPLSLDDAGKD